MPCKGPAASAGGGIWRRPLQGNRPTWEPGPAECRILCVGAPPKPRGGGEKRRAGPLWGPCTIFPLPSCEGSRPQGRCPPRSQGSRPQGRCPPRRREGTPTDGRGAVAPWPSRWARAGIGSEQAPPWRGLHDLERYDRTCTLRTPRSSLPTGGARPNQDRPRSSTQVTSRLLPLWTNLRPAEALLAPPSDPSCARRL